MQKCCQRAAIVQVEQERPGKPKVWKIFTSLQEQSVVFAKYKLEDRFRKDSDVEGFAISSELSFQMNKKLAPLVSVNLKITLASSKISYPPIEANLLLKVYSSFGLFNTLQASNSNGNITGLPQGNCRTDRQKTTQKIINYKPEGRRNIGRPQTI